VRVVGGSRHHTATNHPYQRLAVHVNYDMAPGAGYDASSRHIASQGLCRVAGSVPPTGSVLVAGSVPPTGSVPVASAARTPADSGY